MSEYFQVSWEGERGFGTSKIYKRLSNAKKVMETKVAMGWEDVILYTMPFYETIERWAYGEKETEFVLSLDGTKDNLGPKQHCTS